MKCEGKQKCELYLRVRTVLQLADSIHGVSICTASPGRITSCKRIVFTRTSRKKMLGQQVAVENDCTEVYPNQQVRITVTTVPSYCGITWTDTYHTPGCMHKDLRKNIPECITGRLSYDVNPNKNELKISVSDMLEEYDYHLRLCYKDFICIGTGAYTMMKKGRPIKSAVLHYSRPLPCLCIEGWSAMMDAPRVQVCPFKDRLEELWHGITFDPLEQSLLWEPACPVTAAVGLCEKIEDGDCVDLPHSLQNVSREKVTFTKVDPHPQLCMKFTLGSRSWTRCPFGDLIKAWDVVVKGQQGPEEAQLLSQIEASFSVGLCVKSKGSSECQTTETHSVHVGKHRAVDLNLPGKSCDSCIRVQRLDVKYAVAVVHCFEQCYEAPQDLMWVILPAAFCLFGIIIVTLMLHALLTVYQRRKQQTNGVCTSEKQTDPGLDSMASPLKPQPVLSSKVCIPDSPECGSNEKANLISG
ncbi:putative interleukin-17 receptor E-like [Cololabis saira]|uniref:putative interleukin-17 receptor E-like n=1 Tax=Cololabis saira TaxID=129043 RepID=UPI002AD36AA1|nr:putative interleukin-17 receptor E-like [Cololabis saira]